jgi:hypothetical protein
VSDPERSERGRSRQADDGQTGHGNEPPGTAENLLLEVSDALIGIQAQLDELEVRLDAIERSIAGDGGSTDAVSSRERIRGLAGRAKRVVTGPR